ncbi:MAG: putative ABC transporter permease [Bacilli bacterium]|nr:putative ABC transporter permease [Bacilli bacterium]
MYYINCFFVYSFFGFLLENLICIIKREKKGSGILYGPWTPIYGIGAVLILFISKFLFNILKLEKWLEVLTVLLVITLTLTIIEWASGVLIEKIFHVTFWDYREFRFNIGKYIALEISLIWGISALVVIYIIQPLLDKFIYLIPNHITYILITLIIIDFMVIFIKKKVHK